MTEGLDLPRESVLDEPRLILSGRAEAVVLNHRGLVWFSTDRVRVATAVGLLDVRGQDLEVVAGGPGWLRLRGRIAAARYR
jgi:sporulation protein YqfC